MSGIPEPEALWCERPLKPVASKAMTRDQIEEFRVALVMSYKCQNDEIITSFEKIFDEYDADRDECILLRYKLKCISNGKLTWRPIHTRKMPIPESVKERINAGLKEKAKGIAEGRTPLAIEGPAPGTASARPRPRIVRM